MGAFYSTLVKLNEKAQEQILATTSDESPDFVSADFRKLTIGNVTLIGYFVACFMIILSAIQLGLSNQSVSFLTLGITYTLITISLSTRSLFFIFLEIFGCTCLIELLFQLGFENFSWVIVFLLPFITIAHSIYFLLFYLS
tara:strand:+ start:236 stop:658 length:423 start_codon:yes stop_codon:yes gene_type:complete